jgi:hypothetical protein
MIRFVSNLVVLLLLGSFSFQPEADGWKKKQQAGYSLYFTTQDDKNLSEYTAMTESGLGSVRAFFGSPYKNEFSVYIHPRRKSLDSTWQKDWGMPEFKSECWMVASGVAAKLDMISPATWDTEACEHKYSDKIEAQKLVTHELVHVYHGQWNKSPDFSDVTGIDWLVEGLATYASGQCDAQRLARVKEAIRLNTAPTKLDDFWKGPNRYGQSGSMVMFIDKTFGKAKLISLLPYNTIQDVLKALDTTEAEMLSGWRRFIEGT